MTTENAAPHFAGLIAKEDHQNKFEVLPVAHDQESLARQFSDQADILRREAYRYSLSPLNDAAAPIPDRILNQINTLDTLGYAPLIIKRAGTDLAPETRPNWRISAAQKLLSLNEALNRIPKDEATTLINDGVNWAELSLKAADLFINSNMLEEYYRMLRALGAYYDVTDEFKDLREAVEQRIMLRQ